MNKNRIILLVSLLLGSVSVSAQFPSLNFGYLGLPQKVTTESLAEGIDFIHVQRGELSAHDYYTLSSGAISKQKAADLTQLLANLGYEARHEPLAEFGLHGEPLGVLVRVGHFKDLAEAKKTERALHQSGVTMAVRHTAEDGGASAGPFDISILKVDLNRYKGKIKSALGEGRIQGKETTSSISKRYDAIAAVNAGFFAWEPAVGTVGDPAGVAVIDGSLVSEGTEGRAALVIDNQKSKRVWVAHNLRTETHLKINDINWPVSGLNRAAGKVLNCGNLYAAPTALPAHDFVCRNANETILFDQSFGPMTSAKGSFEFGITPDGLVNFDLEKDGLEVPKGAYRVQAWGKSANELAELISAGQTIEVHQKLSSDEGDIPLKKGLFLVNGGPTLLRAGQLDFSARFKEGWETHFGTLTINDEFVDKKDTATVGDEYSSSRVGFYHGWVVRRHPRTAIGLSENNILYVVVVYGRQAGISAGASLRDMSQIFRDLGVKEAFNLDGGGSSVMVVNQRITGSPSDKSGERPVGDALLFTRD